MKLQLITDHQYVDVDFISETAVQASNLYLVIYDLDASHYVIKYPEPDVLIDNYSKFQLVKLQHIIYGHFYYDDKKVGAQVGCFVNPAGDAKMDTVLLSHDSGPDYVFQTPDSLGCDKMQFVMIDLDDFNRMRWMIGQKEYSLTEYIAQKITGCTGDENGLMLSDHVSLFALGKEFDTSNIMTSSGMAIYVEEQLRNNQTT